jgi:hypothetical protein
MAEGYHIIQRHVFDIRYPVREKAYELQSRFSRLFDREGKAVLQEVADRVIPDSLLLRLEELEVDLGHIPQDRLEKEFPVRLKEELEAALLRVMQEHGHGRGLDRNRSLAGLLEHFLLTGSLPWWAAGALLTDPIAVAERLINDNAEALKRVLLSTGQQDLVRRRLIRQFPEATIRAMVTVLEPGEAAFIFVYSSDIVQVQEREPLFRQDSSEFRESLWIFILTYLLVDRGSNFNRKIFVRSTLTQMARQYNRGYAELITMLYRALEGGPSALIRRSALSEIIQALFREEEGAPKEQDGLADGVAARLGMIRHFLVNGRIAGEGAVPDGGVLDLGVLAGGVPDLGVLAAFFLGLIADAPAAVHELLRSLSEQEGIWARIVSSFDEQVVKGLVHLREPEESDFLFHYVQRLSNLQRQQRFVKSDSSAFCRSVWELILTFIWTERGNLFNTRRFLEYHIRRLAGRYQLPYRKLLEFLVQGIGQDIRSDRDSSLFHSLTVLLQESETEAREDGAVSIKDIGSISAAEWLAALDHYMIHRQWPEHWRLETGATEALLLQQILQRLFRESPLLLMKLLVEVSRRAHPPVNAVALEMVRQAIRLLFGSTALARYRVEHILRVGGKEPLRLLVTFMGGEELAAIRGAGYVSEKGEERPGEEGRRQDKGREVDRRQTEAAMGGERRRSEGGERREGERGEAPADNIYIHNAGLILLHPLLPHYFEQLGLTQQQRWVDGPAQRRAVHLLQYLVDGKVEADGRLEQPEHLLTLNKLLCDIRIQEPIGREIIIREEEKQLAAALLEVLRQRWPKMQNTSSEGIRVSFLQREGALTAIGDGWRLRVEQKGIDVLLSYLPWGWGIVRLPWMNTTIYTEWI